MEAKAAVTQAAQAGRSHAPAAPCLMLLFSGPFLCFPHYPGCLANLLRATEAAEASSAPLRPLRPPPRSGAAQARVSTPGPDGHSVFPCFPRGTPSGGFLMMRKTDEQMRGSGRAAGRADRADTRPAHRVAAGSRSQASNLQAARRTRSTAWLALLLAGGVVY